MLPLGPFYAVRDTERRGAEELLEDDMQYMWAEYVPFRLRDGWAGEQEEGLQVVLAFGGEVQRELRQSMGSDKHLDLIASPPLDERFHRNQFYVSVLRRTPTEFSLERVRSVSVVGVDDFSALLRLVSYYLYLY